MAKFSEKFKGKEIGQAATYAAPHSMSGGPMKMNTPADPTKLKAGDLKNGKNVGRVSMGDPAADDVKRDGIKMRGTGAATKGTMSRGPMG